MTTTNNNKPIFWGSFIVRNSKGIIVDRGEIYSRNGALPEHAFQRIANRYNKFHIIKFIPNVGCMEAE